MTQQQQRSLVRPLQVIKHEKQWCIPCHPSDEIGKGSEKNSSRLVRWQFHRGRNVAKQSAQLRHEPGHLCGTITQKSAESRQISCLRNRRFQNFDERTIWEWFVSFVATPDQRQHSLLRTVGRQFGRNPRFADSRFTGNKNALPFAIARALKKTRQGSAFGCSANKGGSARKRTEKTG